MRRFKIYNFLRTAVVIAVAMSLAGCEDAAPGDVPKEDRVAFTAYLPGAAVTRSAGYTAVSEAYEFAIGMYEPDGGADRLVGDCVYENDGDGALTPKDGEVPLYWHSSTVPYAFKATAGETALSSDQSSKAKWLAQDLLEGYASLDDEYDALEYNTSKVWKKKVPVYLQHKRSLITIILKAGEGVSRRALAFDVAENDLSATVYSYDGATSQLIAPLASETFIDYEADKNGAAESGVSTTRYDAIVEPYDYSASPSGDLIARISLSGQHYSFYAENDTRFNDAVSSNRDSYVLEAGKHLTITVTLSRNSRKALISASIEDWTDDVTTTICDDYGNAGEPIKIKTRDELVAFLSNDTRNKAGNVALVTNDIDLGDWDSSYDLNCTLNLGGCTLMSNNRLFNDMEDAASLQNGTVQTGGAVDAAIALLNNGTIEDVRITAKAGSDAHAMVAGAVVSNAGTISRCRSSLEVSGGTAEYVGGIAATSSSTATKAAIIDACTVSGRVGDGGCGGGIVGYANGYVTNNTFEYGITLLQDKNTHKNIVGARNPAHDFRAENNAWPTVDENYDLTNAIAEENLYSGIIDSQDELLSSVGFAYNIASNRYRLARDITLNLSGNTTERNVAYDLDGDGRQITTDAMIFNAITGKVHDITVLVSDNLVATPKESATDAIAPLAFEVHGENAVIRNIKVKMADGKRIQAANPAGVVVWAWDGAVISNCEARATIQAWVADPTKNQGRKYAGGIVSTVSKATVTQCIFHSIAGDNTLIQNYNANYDNSGEADALSDATIVYYGGIVGGIEKKDGSNDTPELILTDCTCFVTVADDRYHGGILGYSLFANAPATKDCQGNWWPEDCEGVGVYMDGIEATIGKRNAVTPSEKDY